MVERPDAFAAALRELLASLPKDSTTRPKAAASRGLSREIHKIAMGLESTESANRVRLSDGRRLMFAVSGPQDGHPVLYCHGAIGTPLGRSVDVEAIAEAIGIRHIAVSRPGIGGSDRALGRAWSSSRPTFVSSSTRLESVTSTSSACPLADRTRSRSRTSFQVASGGWRSAVRSRRCARRHARPACGAVSGWRWRSWRGRRGCALRWVTPFCL